MVRPSLLAGTLLFVGTAFAGPQRTASMELFVATW